MTPYNKLYANLLPKFKSYEIPSMQVEEIEEMLYDYLIPAITRFHVCTKDLSNRNNTDNCFNEDLSDIEIEILGNFMLIEFLDSNYIRVPNILKGALSSTDFNAFSPANLLDKLLLMKRNLIDENETLLSRYSWLNDNSINLLKSKKNK